MIKPARRNPIEAKLDAPSAPNMRLLFAEARQPFVEIRLDNFGKKGLSSALLS